MIISWSLCFLTLLQILILWVTPFLTLSPALTSISILYQSLSFLLRLSSRSLTAILGVPTPTNSVLFSPLMTSPSPCSNHNEHFGEDTHILLSSLPKLLQNHISNCLRSTPTSMSCRYSKLSLPNSMHLLFGNSVFQCVSNLIICIRITWAILLAEASGSVSLEGGLRFCIYNKDLGDVYAAGPRTPLWVATC